MADIAMWNIQRKNLLLPWRCRFHFRHQTAEIQGKCIKIRKKRIEQKAAMLFIA